MNKKLGLGVVAAGLVVAYGGATWYFGQRAEAAHADGVAQLRKQLGDDAVVEQQYQRGFFRSQSHLVLKWTPSVLVPTSGQPILWTLDSTVMHGPLAGARLAAAAAQTRLSVAGLDEATTRMLEKVTFPALTTVRSFTGGTQGTLRLPAGELRKDGAAVVWQDMEIQAEVNAAGDRVQTTVQAPQWTLTVRPMQSEAAASSPEKVTRFVMQDFQMEATQPMEDGRMRFLSPGTSKGRFAKLDVVEVRENQAEKPLFSLSGITFDREAKRQGNLLDSTSHLRGKGVVGEVPLESISVHETWGRLDVDALTAFQKAFAASQMQASAQGATLEKAQVLEVLHQFLPQMAAALPFYKVTLAATIDGKEGELVYGAEIQTAPTAEELAPSDGWGKALLKASTLHASLQVPQAWVQRVAKSLMGKDLKPEELDALVGMAKKGGYVTQEADRIASAVVLDKGEVKLNGKPMPLPAFLRP